MPAPPVVARAVCPATLDELAAITEKMPAQYRAAVLLAAWCGLRFGEMAELRRKDIDLQGAGPGPPAVTCVAGTDIVGPPKSEAGTWTWPSRPTWSPPCAPTSSPDAAPGRDGLLFRSAGGATCAPAPPCTMLSMPPGPKSAGPTSIPRLEADRRRAGRGYRSHAGQLMARLGHSTPAAAMRTNTPAPTGTGPSPPPSANIHLAEVVNLARAGRTRATARARSQGTRSGAGCARRAALQRRSRHRCRAVRRRGPRPPVRATGRRQIGHELGTPSG